MRVIVNTLAAYRPRTGVGSYIANLMAELPAAAQRDEVAAFPNGWMAGVATVAGSFLRPTQIQHLLPKSIRSAAPIGPGVSRWQGLIKQFGKGLCRRAFQLACTGGAFDLYHEPNFIPWPTELPVVLTVHDLSVMLYPEWHPAERSQYHEQYFARAVKESRHIIAVSETIRQETIRHFNIDPSRITAVHNGVRPDMRPLAPADVAPVLERLNLPPRFALYVGSIEPRKNLLTLMRAYCGLPSDVRSACPLVLAGPWGWNFHDELAYYSEVGRHRGIRHMGYVADADLPALYNAARVLVYPSHYEGFGLPPLEMLACGGAVVASTAAAVREVMGKHAELVAPADEAGWRLALLQVLTDDDYRTQLCHGALDHARQFSWRRAAEQTWQVYRLVRPA